MSRGTAAAGRARNGMTLLAIAAAGAALLRIAIAARIPLVEDEAYYWVWARHLAWGYPDHPPMIAALIALGTRLLGDGVMAIRILPVLLGSATPLLLYLAGRDLFNPPTGRRAALLFLVIPISALGLAFAFPDAPLGLFWALSLWSGWRALRAGGWWWVVAGIAVAMALLSKLTAVFLVAGLAVMWATGPWRRSLRDPGWYAGLAIGLFLILPTLWWNASHGWWVVRMVWERPPWIAPRSVPENLLYFLGGQLLYHGPLALLLVGGMVVALRRVRDPAWRYLACMSAPIMAATFALALGAQAKPHWSSPAYLTGLIALGTLWPDWRRRRPALVSAAAALTALITVAATGAVLLPVGVAVEDTLGRWDRVAEAVYQEAAAREAFILTSSYQSASEIIYHARPPMPVTTPIAAFLLWQSPGDLAGRNVLYVDDRGDRGGNPVQSLANVCRNVQLVRAVPLTPQQVVTLYGCSDFRGSFGDSLVPGSP